MPQADRSVCLRGWAEAWAKVSVPFNRAEERISADAVGRWTIWLFCIHPGMAGDLVVKSSSDIKTVCDVMAGEVWLASGQSNMERSLHNSQGREKIESRAEEIGFRYFVMPHLDADQPVHEVKGHWVVANSKNVDLFSATSASFPIELAQRRKAPVPIVESVYGGTRRMAWTSDPVTHSDGRLQWVLDEWANTLADHPARKAAWDNAMQRWMATLSASDRAKAEKGYSLNGKSTEPLSSGIEAQPAGLYNGMIPPVTKYRIRGILWYQGENDALDDISTYRYRDLFHAMVLSWRDAFGGETLPLLFVQVSRYHGPTYALLRESPAQAVNLADIAMVVSVDLGMYEDVRYHEKRVIEKRLERTAEETAWGVRDASTPFQPVSLTRDAACLRVWFTPNDASPQMHSPLITLLRSRRPGECNGASRGGRSRCAEAPAHHRGDANRRTGRRRRWHLRASHHADRRQHDGVLLAERPASGTLCYGWRDGMPAVLLWSSSDFAITPFRMALDPALEPKCPPARAWRPTH